MNNLKSSYFIINGYRPVESIDVDDINFVKYCFNTSNVFRISFNQYSKINKLYEKYISNVTNILSGKE